MWWWRHDAGAASGDHCRPDPDVMTLCWWRGVTKLWHDGSSPRDSRHTLPGPGPRKRGYTKLHCLNLLQYFIFQVFIATWTIVFLSVDIFLMMKTCFRRYLFWLISICVLCSKQSASKITNMWIMWSFQMPPSVYENISQKFHLMRWWKWYYLTFIPQMGSSSVK